jgi:hypothetical protein
MPSEDPSASTLGVASIEKQLETILSRVLNKDAVGAPKQCTRNDDIKSHLKHVKDYLRACGIEQPDAKIAILFNSLDEEMRDELCGLLEFSKHENDYDWITNKLLELFQPKETQISALIKLFSCRQTVNQSTREFLAEIRRLGYRLLKDLSPEEREKHLIKAFTNGLLQKEVRNALGQMSISSLDEAFKMIKKEKFTDPSKITKENELCLMKDLGREAANDIQKLQNQMSVIQKQLAHIVTVLEQSVVAPQRRPSYAAVTQRFLPRQERYPRDAVGTRPQQTAAQQNAAFRKPVECWQCGKAGHIARFCRQNVCQRCGKSGHATSECLRYKQKRQIRRLENVEDAWTSDSDFGSGDLENESVSAAEVHSRGKNLHKTEAQVHSVAADDEEEIELRALTIHPTVLNGSRAENHVLRRRKKIYPDEINELCEYIEGRRKKPSSPTLISKTRSERAQNKPVVKGQCEETKTKLFCDTGAEVNVVDLSLFETLQKNNRKLKVRPTRKVIRCANNSKMSVLGWTRLWVSVAGNRKICKFWVVPRLFPQIILGIRAMKDLQMSVDPAKDCVWVNGVREPFISKVKPQSQVSEDLGNGRLPGLRVEGRQM